MCFLKPKLKHRKNVLQQAPGGVNLPLQSRCHSKQLTSTIKRWCGQFWVHHQHPHCSSETPGDDIITSSVQQFPRKRFHNAHNSTPAACPWGTGPRNNDFISDHHWKKRIGASWFTTEGQIISPNYIKWPNRRCYPSLYRSPYVTLSWHEGYLNRLPQYIKLLLLLSGSVIDSACSQSNANRRQHR